MTHRLFNIEISRIYPTWLVLQILLFIYSSLDFITDNAYSKSLKSYHGWVVRGIFAVSSNNLFVKLSVITVLCIAIELISRTEYDGLCLMVVSL